MSLPVTAGYKARLATTTQKRSYIVKFTKKDLSVVGFTDHDAEVVYGGVTYIPAYNRSDVVGNSDLGNDSMTYQGVIDSPQITEEGLRVGEWDNAKYVLAELYWDDHSTGIRIVKAGQIGEISLQRLQYSAELSGLARAYGTTFGNITSPMCRHDLYDAGCTIDPYNFTYTGTIDGVATDGVTITDAGRTEPGPAGGIAITNITQADPGVVTLLTDPDPALTELQLVAISGVVGMAEVNTQTAVHNPSGNTFNLSVDTSGFNAYTSGGTMTPLGGEDGWFRYGVITWTSGDNVGSSMEIDNYVPGQLRLALPMPNPVQVGDTYSLRAGCNKFASTCKTKFGFNNIENFDGEPFLTGNDKLVEIGKQQ